MVAIRATIGRSSRSMTGRARMRLSVSGSMIDLPDVGRLAAALLLHLYHEVG